MNYEQIFNKRINKNHGFKKMRAIGDYYSLKGFSLAI